jgi:hypothetical protein
MSRLTIPASLSGQLSSLSQSVELCDETGRVLGMFLPSPDPSEYERVEPDFSEEELQRQERSEKWYTTAQVIKHLESLQ